MNTLVATNIRKTIETLNTLKKSLDLRLGGLCPQPQFYGTKQNITSAQSDFFGFYVLANTIRSMLRGINFIVASRSVLESKLLAPSIALSYTAGFHGLMAQLALEGRPFFEDGSFAWAEKGSNGKLTLIEPPPDLLLISAILTKNNIWSFRNRNRSHNVFWRELLNLFGKSSYTIPQYYYDLFDYLFWGRQKEPKLGVKGLKEMLENPALREANKLHLEDAKEEFLNRIAKVRHMALYGGFGEDPWIVEAMWNNDVSSSSGIERQARKFYSFSEAMLVQVSSELVDLLSHLKLTSSIRKALCVCIYIQWFDTPLIADVPNKLLKSQVRQIKKWLHGR
jgi:hypothetical protein